MISDRCDDRESQQRLISRRSRHGSMSPGTAQGPRLACPARRTEVAEKKIKRMPAGNVDDYDVSRWTTLPLGQIR